MSSHSQPGRPAETLANSCFTVSRWDRLLLFGGLNLAAIALFVVCFTLMPILSLRPRKFAILYVSSLRLAPKGSLQKHSRSEPVSEHLSLSLSLPLLPALACSQKRVCCCGASPIRLSIHLITIRMVGASNEVPSPLPRGGLRSLLKAQALMQWVCPPDHKLNRVYGHFAAARTRTPAAIRSRAAKSLAAISCNPPNTRYGCR